MANICVLSSQRLTPPMHMSQAPNPCSLTPPKCCSYKIQ
jgi:hypothetical protein